jgi:hypothetical protein
MLTYCRGFKSHIIRKKKKKLVVVYAFVEFVFVEVAAREFDSEPTELD